MPQLSFEQFEIDERKVSDGVWWAIHRNADGTIGGEVVKDVGDRPALLIKPQGVEFERALEESRRPHLPDVRGKRLAADVERKILAEAMAEALWAGAANMTLGGVAFEWTKPKAARMLAEVKHENLRDFILFVSRDRAALAREEEEQAAGN